jgi:hypothetical protein
VLEASSTGFRTHKRGEFTLEVEQVLRLDIPLEIGSAGESATVNDAPPALLSGGVIPKGDGSDGSYAVSGARADNTGAAMNPPIKCVQEFKMPVSGFSAEYGRYAGGMLTVAAKSGAHRLRGARYEFPRNDALGATGYFDPGKAKLRRNQFGATVSGPFHLPKIYDGRHRTFFIAGWINRGIANGLRSAPGRTTRLHGGNAQALRHW